jgi:hypothetical protein
MLHGKTGSRHLLKLGADRLVDLEELGDAAIDADSLALVKIALDVGLGDALLVARADNTVFLLNSSRLEVYQSVSDIDGIQMVLRVSKDPVC